LGWTKINATKMATALQNTISTPRVSTLDVLWAFYQSQPRKVKVAFRNLLETQDNANTKQPRQIVQWKKDLREIRLLKDGWDDEGAPSINRDAINNTIKIATSLTTYTAQLIRLYPTPLGAVSLKLETEKGRIKCDIGDTQMSYFVKRPGIATEHHSFEDINADTLSTLRSNLESII